MRWGRPARGTAPRAHAVDPPRRARQRVRRRPHAPSQRVPRRRAIADDIASRSPPLGPTYVHECGRSAVATVVNSATSSASRPLRMDVRATGRASSTVPGRDSASSTSRTVSSARFRAVTWCRRRSRSTALATYPAYRVRRSSSSRSGAPGSRARSVITATTPLGPMTGTDQEPAMSASAEISGDGPARSPAQVLLDHEFAERGRPPCRATRRTDRQSCPAALTRPRPRSTPRTRATRRSRDGSWCARVPSAARIADRISDRLSEGSATTSRSARPCSRDSCRRAVASTSCPAISAATSSR